MSHLVDHARMELTILGERQEVIDVTVEMIEAFNQLGHSGTSALIHLRIIHDLLNFKNLSPLTDNPQEWTKLVEEMTGGEDLWQSRRNPACFSNDGGKTHYNLDDRDTVVTSRSWVELMRGPGDIT